MVILENISINVHEADFDVAGLQRGLLSGLSEEGAVATFTGYVRRANDDRQVSTLELEHYPGMTEQSIKTIISACEFIMDYLKTRAPFWKKELGPFGEIWVSARQDDESRAARWQDDSTP